jgi:type IV secretory system conjugative DNA transfer VirD4/TraG family protein
MGSPGSGKSRLIIELVLQQLISKGFALFLYDFKYDQLSRLAYQHFLTYRDQYPASAGFFHINFTDLERSHRCNVLDPATLGSTIDAVGASKTILFSMNKTWINRQGDFFIESPINLLAAIIWYLKKYDGGKYCTLPHAIELAQVHYDRLFSILNAEADISTLIQPFIEAYHNKTTEMLDGQVASARIPLGRLSSPDLYYVLTGDDCKLDINDPAAPRILCLGGDPPRQEALAPILSLYIDQLNKLVNRTGRHKCAIVCDEFATVRAAGMITTLGTARSNDIVPVLAVQDITQLRARYTRDEAELFLNISGNLFCGQIGGDTAKWVSERIPRVLQDRTTISINDSDTSISKSLQWDNPVNQATIACLSSGEFVGMVADDPGEKLEMKAFHAMLKREEERGGGKNSKGKMTAEIEKLPLCGKSKSGKSNGTISR